MDLKRGASAELLSALEGAFYPVCLCHLDWPDAPVWVHSGAGVISWGGYDWQGVGLLGNIEVPPESSGVTAVEAVLSLAGLPADLDDFADDAIRNRDVVLYFGVVAGRPGGEGGTTLVGDPEELFSGTMDGLNLTAQQTDDGVDHGARVNVATGPSARSAATIYHSDEDQRRRFPADTAGRLVILAYAKAQKMTWPET